MAISVINNSALTGDKTSATSKTIDTFWIPSDSTEKLVLLFAWQGSVASQTLSLSGVASGYTATILAQRESSGLSGIAVIFITLTPGRATLPGVDATLTITASTGNIVAWGGNAMKVTGAANEIGVAAVGADSASTTSAAPTATSGSLAVGDLVIGAISLKGPSGDTITQDTDTVGGTWTTLIQSGTSGGSATGNQTFRGAYKIVTAAGAQTYNPVPGTARNYAELILGIKPAVAISGTDANGTTTESSKLGILTADPPPAVSTSTGALDPDSTATPGGEWTNPDNILSSDNVYAGNTVLVGTSSADLDALYSTADLGIPAGAIITDISAQVVFELLLPGLTYTLQVQNFSTGAGLGTPLGLDTSQVAAGDPAIDWGLSSAQRDAIVTGGLRLALVVTNSGGASQSPNVDAIQVTITYTPTIPPNSSESASASTGGGTAKSGTDSNGTTTESGTETSAISGSDADGTPVETASPRFQPAVTDANSTTTEASSITVPVAASDSGVSTEITSSAVHSTVTDANSATTEASPLVFAPLVTDTDGASTETGSAFQLATSSDANSAITEVASAGVPVSASDVNGAATEATTQISQNTSADSNAATTEASSPVVHPSVADANGATTEIPSIRLGATDANAATTEAGVISVPVAVSDLNGATTEAPTLVAKPSGVDANSTVTENSPLVFAPSSADSGTDAETISSRLISYADANSTTTEIGNASQPGTPVGTDAGGGAESAAVPLAAIGGSDTGVGAQNGAVSVPVNVTDVASSTDSATSVNRTISVEIGAGSDAVNLSFTATSTDIGTSIHSAALALLSSDQASSISAQGLIVGLAEFDLAVGTDFYTVARAGMISADAPITLISAKLDRGVLTSSTSEKPVLVSTTSDEPDQALLGKVGV